MTHYKNFTMDTVHCLQYRPTWYACHSASWLFYHHQRQA